MRTRTPVAVPLLMSALFIVEPSPSSASDDDVKKIVAELDTRYQRAVKTTTLQ